MECLPASHAFRLGKSITRFNIFLLCYSEGVKREGFLSVREEAKAERRRRIVAAARELVRESGETGFSMRALAEEAGVSLVTPYNLFGSKLAVMLAMLDADVEQYQARLAGLNAPDAAEMVFAAVRLAREFYEAEPGFYRAVLLEVNSSGEPALREGFTGPRYQFWRGLVSALSAEGWLDKGLELDAYTSQLAHIFGAYLTDWILGGIDLEEMEARIAYGFALHLLAGASDARRAELKARVFEMQEKLQALKARRGTGEVKRA